MEEDERDDEGEDRSRSGRDNKTSGTINGLVSARARSEFFTTTGGGADNARTVSSRGGARGSDARIATECDEDFPVKQSQANYEKGKVEIVDFLTSPSCKFDTALSCRLVV